MTTSFCKKFYAKKAILDTVYWFSEKYALKISESDDFYEVSCQEPSEEFEKLFQNKLNDYNLRTIISEKTDNIRDLIIAKAFHPDLIKIEPVGSIEDPVDMNSSNETE